MSLGGGGEPGGQLAKRAESSDLIKPLTSIRFYEEPARVDQEARGDETISERGDRGASGVNSRQSP